MTTTAALPSTDDDAWARLVEGLSWQDFGLAAPLVEAVADGETVGPGMYAFLTEVDPATLAGDARVDLIRALERAAAMISGLQQYALASVVDATTASGLEGDEARHEVGAALRLSPGTAADRTRVAAVLRDRLPLTMSSLSRGDVSYLQAVAVAEHVRDLPPDLAAALESRVFPKIGHQTVAETRRACRAALEAVDPEGCAERHRKAVKARTLERMALRDAMESTWFSLPAGMSADFWSVLSADAREQKATRRELGLEDPGIDALRVDALVHAVLHNGGVDPAFPRVALTGQATARPRTEPSSKPSPAETTTQPVPAPAGESPAPAADCGSAAAGAPATPRAQTSATPDCDADADPAARADADPAARADADPAARADADPTARADADPTARADADPTARADADPTAPAGAFALSQDRTSAGTSRPAANADRADDADVGADSSTVEDASRDAEGLERLAQSGDATPRVPRCSCGGRQTAAVVIDLPTLLGLATNPGELPGYGAVPAEVARAMAVDRDWVRWTVDPGTRRVIDRGSLSYRPSDTMHAFIAARDRVCGFPGCSQPAHRCDCDHIAAFDHDGTTTAGNVVPTRPAGRDGPAGGTVTANLGPLCRQHHNAKTHGHWQLAYDPVAMIKTWTSPLGKRYDVATDPPLL